MILMDMVKEHSCAIQPAFGGSNQLNFGLLFQPLSTPDPLPLEFGETFDPFSGLAQFIPTNVQPQANAGIVTNASVGVHQGTINQQPQLSIDEMIDNILLNPAVPHTQQNAAGTVVNESGTAHQPQQNIWNTSIHNVISQIAAEIYPPLNLTSVLNNSVLDEPSFMHDSPLHMFQPQVPVPTPLENIGDHTYHNYTAASVLPTQQEMNQLHFLYEMWLHLQQTPSQNLELSDSITEMFLNVLYPIPSLEEEYNFLYPEPVNVPELSDHNYTFTDIFQSLK